MKNSEEINKTNSNNDDDYRKVYLKSLHFLQNAVLWDFTNDFLSTYSHSKWKIINMRIKIYVLTQLASATTKYNIFHTGVSKIGYLFVTLYEIRSWTIHVNTASLPTGTVIFVIGELKFGSGAIA